MTRPCHRFVRTGAIPIALAAILGLGGCGGDAPILNAVGSYSDVAILTDL